MRPLGIGAIGVVTAVGDDTPMTMASILAGVQLFDDLDVRGPGGRPTTGGRVPLADEPDGTERLAALGLLALQECADEARPDKRAPILLCLPKPSQLGGPGSAVLAGVAADAALPVDRERSIVLAEGRQSPILALTVAHRLIESGAAGCFLAATDSLIGADRVARLRRQGRVSDDGRADRFVPAEAAVALWLTSVQDERTIAAVISSAVTPEPRVVDGDDPVTGVALTNAIRTVVTAAGGVHPEAIVHDLSGPQDWFEELALSSARPPLADRPPRHVVAPALSTGETGVAAAALSMAVAAFFLTNGEVAESVLTVSTGDEPMRGATLVVRAAHTRRS